MMSVGTDGGTGKPGNQLAKSVGETGDSASKRFPLAFSGDERHPDLTTSVDQRVKSSGAQPEANPAN
jgi:hypothetical protein